MAITSADPDNNPATPRPSLKFGTPNDSGNQSLRKEFPHETDTGPDGQPRLGASLSEYYGGGGVVPSSALVEGQNQSAYGDIQLIESRWTFDAGRSGFPSEINNSPPDNLFYVRKVKTTQAPVPAVNIPVTFEKGVNQWRVNYNQSQGAGAYISIFDNAVRVYFTGTLGQTQTIDAITELTVNGITYTKGSLARIEESPNTGSIYQRDYSMSTSEPAQVGDLLFAWQYPTNGVEKHGYTFKIPNGIIGEEYEHDGYTYTTGGDASGVSVLKEETGEVMGFYPPNTPYGNKQFQFRYENQPIYNTWYDRYYIKRRTTADAINNQTVPINNLVPLSGPISFSQLYGSANIQEANVDIPGHSPADEGYIWNSSLYPANITTDGTEIRSGILPGALAYRDLTNGTNFTTMSVPLGTLYVDPATFPSGIKFTLKASSIAQRDIKYDGKIDDDGSNGYIKVKNIGIRIDHHPSGRAALFYTGGPNGNGSFLFSAQGNNGNMKTFSRYLNEDGSETSGSSYTSSATNDTGRFIVYLAFDYAHNQVYTGSNDPDFKLSIDPVNVSWETA